MRGFTLLELLVVLFIIGLLASLAVVSIRGGSSRSVEEEAKRIQVLLEMASREAVISFQEIGVLIQPDGYAFRVLDEEGGWVPMEANELYRDHRLPEGMSFSLWVESDAIAMNTGTAEEGPRLFFFSSGERLPFRLEVLNAEGKRGILEAGMVGPVTLSWEEG